MINTRIILLSIHQARSELHLRMAGQPARLLWPLLNSLTTLCIYAFVFGNVMQARIGAGNKYDYAVAVFVGIIYWSFFIDLYGRFAGIYLANAELIKKKHFSYLVFTLSNILSASLYFLISITALLFFVVIAGLDMHWSGIPILLSCWIFIIIIAACLGLSSSILTVYFPDIGLAMPVVLQGLFWLTPIVYPISILPEFVKNLVNLNILAVIVTYAQNCFVTVPQVGSIASVAMPLIIVCLATVLFVRLRGALVDEL